MNRRTRGILRKNLLLTGAIVAALVLMLASNAFTVWAGHQKLALCHNGKTLVVGNEGVQAHLAHGDKLHECNPPPPD